MKEWMTDWMNDKTAATACMNWNNKQIILHTKTVINWRWRCAKKENKCVVVLMFIKEQSTVGHNYELLKL